MNAADILTTADSKKGLRALRAFLDYCEKGHLHQNIITHKAPDSDFEIAVMDALAQYGYQCEPQVGVNGFFIDIAVKNPYREGHFLLGIECDGATYHSAKSVRDRDRLRQEILENLGWEMYRIWSTDWFKNPEGRVVAHFATARDFEHPICTRDRRERCGDSCHHAAYRSTGKAGAHR